NSASNRAKVMLYAPCAGSGLPEARSVSDPWTLIVCGVAADGSGAGVSTRAARARRHGARRRSERDMEPPPGVTWGALMPLVSRRDDGVIDDGTGERIGVDHEASRGCR